MTTGDNVDPRAAQLHSPEELGRRIQLMLDQFGTELDPASEAGCREVFTGKKWTIGRRNMLRVLNDMLQLELEVHRGLALSGLGRDEIYERYGKQTYRAHVVRLIKPVARGSNWNHKVNQYHATAYVARGFELLQSLPDTKASQVAQREVRLAMPYFFDAFALRASVHLPEVIAQASKLLLQVMGKPPVAGKDVSMTASPAEIVVTMPLVEAEKVVTMSPPAAAAAEKVVTSKIVVPTDPTGGAGAPLARITVSPVPLPSGPASTLSDATGGLTEDAAGKPVSFRCVHCLHVFQRAAAYAKHKCEQAKKHELANSAAGTRAWRLFNLNQQVLGRRELSCSQFGKAHFLRAWVKFAEWTRDVQLPDVRFYLQYLKRMRYDNIGMWTRSDVYAGFIKSYDTHDYRHVIDRSIQELRDLAEVAEVPVAQVWDVLDFGVIYQLVVQRRLSMWVLSASERWLAQWDEYLAEQQNMLDAETKYWATHRSNAQVAPLATAYASEQVRRWGL